MAIVVFDPENKALKVYIASISQELDVEPSWKGQIAFLKADKIFIFVLSKYTDFVNIFSKDLGTKLLNHTEINDYAISLIKGQ